MLGNIGMPELLFILVIVLLFFGAKRIPEIAGSFGKGIREFKKSMTDVERSINEPAREERIDQRLDRPRVAEPTAPLREDEADRPEPKRLLS